MLLVAYGLRSLSKGKITSSCVKESKDYLQASVATVLLEYKSRRAQQVVRLCLQGISVWTGSGRDETAAHSVDVVGQLLVKQNSVSG